MDRTLSVVEKVKNQMLPLAFPAFGLPVTFDVETLELVESHINEVYPLGHVPMWSTLVPFAIHLGECFVRNLEGAFWVDAPFDSWQSLTVQIPMPHGYSWVHPYARVSKFWFDRSDGLAVLYRMMRDVQSGVVDLASVQPGAWLEFPRSDGSVDRYRFMPAPMVQ